VPVSKTEKLYLDDAYTREFRATVVASQPATGGARSIVLDKTYFYPESGGQLADGGRIGDLSVVDVQEGEGETVVHTVAAGPEVPVGTELDCAVDGERRFDHMQQHTGQHVLSRAFIEEGDLHTVSFHMGEDTCTIDVEGGDFSPETAARAEALANRVVEDNRAVSVRTVPVDELDAAGLRRKVPEGVRDARLVEVGGFDVIPCCGTHVRATGELGLIKVLKWEKVKAATRVHFKVGRRALADYAHKHDVVSELSNRFTTGTTEVLAKVDKLVAENQSSRKSLKAMSQKLAALEMDELLAAAQPVGEARLVVRLVDGDGAHARALSSALKSAAGVVAILGAADGTVVCSASDGVGVDVASGAVARATEMGGSGGGRGSFAQVKLPPDADVGAFIEQVGDDVKSKL